MFRIVLKTPLWSRHFTREKQLSRLRRAGRFHPHSLQSWLWKTRFLRSFLRRRQMKVFHLPLLTKMIPCRCLYDHSPVRPLQHRGQPHHIIREAAPCLCTRNLQNHMMYPVHLQLMKSRCQARPWTTSMRSDSPRYHVPPLSPRPLIFLVDIPIVYLPCPRSPERG